MFRTRTCRTGIIGLALATAVVMPLQAEDGYTPPVEVRSEQELPHARTGLRFRQSLDSNVPGVAWKEVPLRSILRQLSELYEVAILCDRRIDPTVDPEVTVSNQSLSEVIQVLSRHIAAEPRVVGNCIYLGPLDHASIIRTLVELRKEELLKLRTETSKHHWVRLQRPRTVQWGDLTSPREIVERIAERFSVQVSNPAILPHDLWPGGVLPEMTAAEMLTLVLVQCDLTFRWDNDLSAISIEALPSDRGEIVIERSVLTTAPMRSRVSQYSDSAIQLRFEGAKLFVRGRVEEVESFLGEISGKTPRLSKEANPGGAVPLEQREFTLSVTGAPIQAILDNLKSSGISFEFDKELFEKAGIDLQTPVSVDLKQASAREFLSAVFRPVAVDFAIEGTAVRLRPRK